METEGVSKFDKSKGGRLMEMVNLPDGRFWDLEKSFMLMCIVQAGTEQWGEEKLDWERVSQKLCEDKSPTAKIHWSFTSTECEQRHNYLISVAQEAPKLQGYEKREVRDEIVMHLSWALSDDLRDHINRTVRELRNVGIRIINDVDVPKPRNKGPLSKEEMDQVIKLLEEETKNSSDSDESKPAGSVSVAISEMPTEVMFHGSDATSGPDNKSNGLMGLIRTGEEIGVLPREITRLADPTSRAAVRYRVKLEQKDVASAEDDSDRPEDMELEFVPPEESYPCEDRCYPHEVFANCFHVNNDVLRSDEEIPYEQKVHWYLRSLCNVRPENMVPVEPDVDMEDDVTAHTSSPHSAVDLDTTPQSQADTTGGAKETGRLSRDVGRANAPTLSKLLEMPPRDRTQPLPQITSLMAEGQISEAETSPIKQDSPTKLLAALGTTSTPVRAPAAPIARGNEPFDFTANVAAIPSASAAVTIKSSNRISQTYAKASGEMSCNQGERKESPAEASSSGNQTSDVQNERQAASSTDDSESLQTIDTLPYEFLKPDFNVAPQVVITIEDDSASSVTQESQGDAEQRTVDGMVDVDLPVVKSTTEDDEIICISPPKRTEKMEETKGSGPETRLRGRKDGSDVPSAPLSRYPAKDKSKDEESMRSVSTPALRRSSGRIGGSEESAATPKVPPRRLFTGALAAEGGTPNLRSRKITTPTDDDSKGITRKPKGIIEKVQSKEKGQTDEGAGVKQDVADKIENDSAKKSKDVQELTVEAAEDETTKQIEANSDGVKKRQDAGTPVSEQGESEDATTKGGSASTSGKRVTRRSVKIVDEPVELATKEDDSSKMKQQRKRKAEDSNEKEKEEEEEKRITRARAKDSSSPPRKRTKSTSSTKSDAKDVESSDTEGGPARATRRRTAGTPTLQKQSSSGDTETPKVPDPIEDSKWEASMLRFLKRAAQHERASILTLPIGDDLNKYTHYIRQPVDFSTLRKSVQTKEIRTPPELEFNLFLMFANFSMYLPNRNKLSDEALISLRSEIVSLFKELREEYIASRKESPAVQQ